MFNLKKKRIIWVGVCTTNSRLSKMIRKLSGVDYSHSYIRFHVDLADDDLIFHATSDHGVSLANHKLFNAVLSYRKEYPLVVDEKEYTHFVKTIVSKSGTSYDKMELRGKAIVLILRKFGIRIQNPWRNGAEKYLCSELIANVLKHNKLFDMDTNYDNVEPADIYQVLDDNKDMLLKEAREIDPKTKIMEITKEAA